jgi:MerR family transcriptional regulator, light-induced transcriptional regulator
VPAEWSWEVSVENYTQRLFEALINGDRPTSRAIVDECYREGITAECVVSELFWPTYEQIETLFREDKLTTLAHHMATRLLRSLCDQAAQKFSFNKPVGRSVFAVCGPTDADELAGQMAADLLEAEGFSVNYAGSGIANDELLEIMQSTQPDVLLLFSSAPGDLPGIRELIDTMREIGACDRVQIVVGGGVFNRAEGLAEEIGADLWAEDPTELCQIMIDYPQHRAEDEQRTVGRNRKPTRKAA